MSRYLDPKSDLVFKKVFSGHPILLKSFLNAVLPLLVDCLIEDLGYLSSENIPEIPDFKYTIVDVRCFDQQGRHFIVEIQMSWSKYFMQRLLFNTASVYVRQLYKTEHYRALSPVYGLGIVADSFSEESDWLHHYQLRYTQNTEKIVEGIQLVVLELPKFKPKTLTERKLTLLWLRFLTEIDETIYPVDPALLAVEEIKQALALTEEAAYTPAELRAYERNWDAIRAKKTLIEDRIEEGLEKGLAQGLEQEREEGRKNCEYEIARNLLANGLPAEFVAQNTGVKLALVLVIEKQLK